MGEELRVRCLDEASEASMELSRCCLTITTSPMEHGVSISEQRFDGGAARRSA